jgi:hypothetical protein
LTAIFVRRPALSLVFRTDPDNPYAVEIAGVGTLGGSGRGGIPVEHAAKFMTELQDDKGKPLTPKKLEAAARKFADDHGLKVTSVKNFDPDDPFDETLERLRVEAGAFPRGYSPAEISAMHDDAVRAQLEAHEVAESPLLPEQVPTQETSVLPETPPQEA